MALSPISIANDVGLVIEVDGSIHQQQEDYDALRDRIISARGLQIIRFPNDRLFTELPTILREIQLAAQKIQNSSGHTSHEEAPAT